MYLGQVKLALFGIGVGFGGQDNWVALTEKVGYESAPGTLVMVEVNLSNTDMVNIIWLTFEFVEVAGGGRRVEGRTGYGVGGRTTD